MTDEIGEKPSLTEVAVVAGATRATARQAIESGVIQGDDLSWIDALVLRVYATVRSMRFPGEALHGVPAVALGRAILGAATARQEAEEDQMPGAAQLVVTRDGVHLFTDLAGAYVYLERDLAGSESAQILPVGRWWYDMRWRMGSRSDSPSTSPSGQRA